MSDVINTCLGKIRYATKAFADATAEMLSAKYGRELRAYHCGLCDGWHTTHK